MAKLLSQRNSKKGDVAIMPIKKKKVTKKLTAPKLKKKSPKKNIKKTSSVKKTIKKAALKKKIIKKKPSVKKPVVEGLIIGEISHYFPHVNAAVIKLKSSLKIGDVIRIKGHTTDFQETIISMQMNRTPITEAKNGDEIGLLVSSRVRAGDTVYKV